LVARVEGNEGRAFGAEEEKERYEGIVYII